MSPSGITAAYDDLTDRVRVAVELRWRLVRRISRRTSWIIGLRRRPMLPVNPTKPTAPAWRQQLIDVATEQERSSPLFACVTATYWVEALSDHIAEQLGLGQDRLSALEKIHEMRVRAVTGLPRWLRFNTIAGVLVAAVGFLGSQLPKESFAVLGIANDYGWYRLALFAGVLGILLYVGSVFVIARPARALTGDRHVAAAVGLVLTYCSTKPHEP